MDEYYVPREDETPIEIKARWHYWRSLFEHCNPDDLEDILGRFLKSVNLKLGTFNIHNGTDLTLPLITIRKDILLRDIILKQKKTGHILLVGFWEGTLLFNLGIRHNFRVDGLDLFTESVDIAKQQCDTLPRDLQELFVFHHRQADDLDGLPKYDIIINIILEHLQNPRRVILEHLKHLKKDGIYYLTTPLKYGCSSPGHLHCWMCPEDIAKLFPKGYELIFRESKYCDNDPYENYYVVEIKRKRR